MPYGGNRWKLQWWRCIYTCCSLPRGSWHEICRAGTRTILTLFSTMIFGMSAVHKLKVSQGIDLSANHHCWLFGLSLCGCCWPVAWSMATRLEWLLFAPLAKMISLFGAFMAQDSRKLRQWEGPRMSWRRKADNPVQIFGALGNSFGKGWIALPACAFCLLKTFWFLKTMSQQRDK